MSAQMEEWHFPATYDQDYLPDPDSPFWFGLPPEVARTVHPYDDYHLARSLVDAVTPEDDLFAGVAEAAAERASR